MPAGHHDTRDRRGHVIRQVEIRCDVVIGSAFKNNAFDAVSVSLKRTDSLRMQGRLIRKRTQLFAKERSKLSLACSDLLRRLQLFVGL